MSRRLGVIIGLAIVVGYAGLAALGIALVSAQQATKQAVDSNTRAIQALESRVNAIPVPAAASPRPSTPASQAPTVKPAFIKIADTLGDVWLASVPIAGAYIPVKAGTKVTFTASASSPVGRPLQYQFTTGGSPRLTVICDWSPDPTCAWVAAQSVISGNQVTVEANVRDDNPADGTDVLVMLYNVGPSSG